MTEIKDGKKKKTGSDREISKLTDDEMNKITGGCIGPWVPRSAWTKSESQEKIAENKEAQFK